MEEAAAIMASYFGAFPNVKQYMERIGCRSPGPRATPRPCSAGVRHLPELHSANFRVRQAAERQAMNAGIQGLAADIFKVALVRLDSALEARGLSSRIVLQVHDEILVEVVAAEREEVLALTVETMEHAFELRVPLAVYVAIGDSWAAGKEPALDAGAEFDEPIPSRGEPVV